MDRALVALDARLRAGTAAAMLDDLCAFQAFVLSDRAQAEPERQARFEWSKHATWWGRRRRSFKAPLSAIRRASS